MNNDTTPIVSLSITNLDIEVEEGRVYKDSFFIESENKIPIEGYVCTTSDKMAVEVERLEGIRQEILDSASQSLVIPMNPHCESLNAAVAAAIAMWQMDKLPKKQ